METLILIGSIIGIVNSFILIIYALSSKKGNRNVNLIFALLILMLTLRISKSILLTFSDGLHDLLLTLGLSGFLAIGPVYYFFTEAVIDPKFKLKGSQLLHLLPAIIFTFMWVFLDSIREDWETWKIFYRTILLQYIIYMAFAIHKVWLLCDDKFRVKKQLNIISIFLLSIWLAYLMNDAAGIPYISGAILYSILIYFSLIIIVNKGYVVNLSPPKYEKTGLGEEDKKDILTELDRLFDEDKIYRSNTISLAKLAKQLNVSTHAVSQVINENKKKSFFELLGFYRIEEAKDLLAQSPEIKVADIAFDVGYNSLSAFNATFKKVTGLTPTQFRNAQ